MMQRRTLDIILYKTYAELKSEAQRTYVGLLWWVLEPVLFMAIFYFVFAVLFQRGGEHFVPFLLIGLVVWHWFQATVAQCSTIIVVNRPLIQQVFVPKSVFPAVVLLTNTIKFVIVFLLLVGFLIIYGYTPVWAWLQSIAVLAATLMLIAAISYLAAAVTPMIPDLRILIENAMRGLMFLSGIFYDIDAMDEPFRSWLYLNPLAAIISELRGVLMHDELLDWWTLLPVAAASLVLLLAGMLIISFNESRYAKIIL